MSSNAGSARTMTFHEYTAMMQKREAAPPSFDELKPLIFKICISFATTTGLPLDELEGEARQAYARSLKYFDPAKGAAFPTLLTRSLTNRLTDWAYKQRHRSAAERTSLEAYEALGGQVTETSAGPERVFMVKQALAGLSQDAQNVVRVALRTPTAVIEMIRDLKSDRQVIRGLRRHFRGLGWSVQKFTKACDEIMVMVEDLAGVPTR